MSLRSMTGFASAPVETEAVKGSVTIRSLNHRYLDLSVHLPRRLQGLEPELRAALQGRLQRGKVEVSVRAALKDEGASVMVAPRPVIAGIVRGLREIQAEHGLEGGVSVADVARFPGAVEVLDGDTSVDEAARKFLMTEALKDDGTVSNLKAVIQSMLEEPLSGEAIKRTIGLGDRIEVTHEAGKDTLTFFCT